MLTTINLYGPLGKRFGKKWELDICHPAEAVRALDVLCPGFAQAIIELDTVFRVRVGKRAIGEKLLTMPSNGKTISFTPLQKGAASGKAIGQVILGVVLVIVGVVLAAYGGATLATYGVALMGAGLSLTLGGIAALLAPTPATDAANPDDKHKASYQMSGAINTIQQGAPVPYCFGGPIIVGSAVVSASVYNEDIATPPGTSGSSNSNSGAPVGGQHTTRPL